METKRHIKRFCLLHRFLYKKFILKRNSIICKYIRTRFFEALKVCKFFSLKVFWNCCRWIYIYRGLLSLLQNILKSFNIIYHRLCISHAHNRCEAACCRSLSSCFNILLICKTGVPEMYMCINKTRRNYHSFGIYNLLIITVRCLIILVITITLIIILRSRIVIITIQTSNLLNNSIFYDNICIILKTTCRVDYVAVFN